MLASEWILSLLKPQDSILDIGIGTGTMWKDTQYNVKGFDINNQNPGVEVVLGNACRVFPFSDKTFGVGILSNVIDVLPESCKGNAINEATRVAVTVIVTSLNPLEPYVSGLNAKQVNGDGWFGAVINPTESTVVEQPLLPEQPEPAEVHEPDVTEDEPEVEQEEKKPKLPFWKRKSIKAVRYISIVASVLNFLKYLFQHETITVPLEISTVVPIIGGSVTHYKVTMATYEAIMSIKNYLAKA